MLNFAPLLRGLGLESVNTFWRGQRSKWRAPEAPKKVLTRSRWHAFSRNLVHVLPSGILVGLIWLNYGNHYIGPTFIENPEKDTFFLAAIQFCAKLEELLCIASLTAIVLHALRSELLGDGVPIGLLGSGIWFSSLGAFWSPDFLGTFSWTWRRPSWRRCRFYGLLVICGALAATIGPSSAILMLPRSQNFPAGGVSFYLNGSADQFWPSTVIAASEPDYCLFANTTQYAVCPSGGFDSLRQTLKAFNYSSFCVGSGGGSRYAPLCQAKGADGNREWNNFLVQSSEKLIPPLINGVRSPFWGNNGSAAVQPHAATAVLAQQLVGEWWDTTQHENAVNNHEFKWSYDLESLVSATNPFVRTACTAAQNLSADADTAGFPFILRPLIGKKPMKNFTSWSGHQVYKSSSIAGLDRNETSHIRTQWVPLAMDEFGDSHTGINTVGLLIEWPDSYGYRLAVGCSVAAAWHNSTAQSTRSVSYGGWSVPLTAMDFGPHDDSPDADTTNSPVTLDGSWLDLLSPTISGTDSESVGYSLNTIETLLTDTGFSTIEHDLPWRGGVCWNPLTNLTLQEMWNSAECQGVGFDFIEQLLAIMVVDGLSRYQSSTVYDTVGDIRDWSTFRPETLNRTHVFAAGGQHHTGPQGGESSSDPPFEWLTVDAVGYAYYPCETSDYLALAGVCAYLFIALSHLIYTLLPLPSRFRRAPPTSSSTWDSVTELLVLCQNSPPPVTSHKLENTSAGIEQLKTYRTRVKVRAFPPADGIGAPKVALVLDDDSTSSSLVARSRAASGSNHNSLLKMSPKGHVVEYEESLDLQQSSSSSSMPHLRDTLRQHELEHVVTEHKYS